MIGGIILYSIEEISDKLILKINSAFEDFLSALTIYSLGQGNIDQINDRICVSPPVGIDLQIEPLPIKDIKAFKNYYPHFLLEVYHGSFVQLWNDYLDEIFSLFVEWHFSGTRQFKELKKPNVKLDFNSDIDFSSQIKKAIINNFSFQEYSERQKILNRIVNPELKGTDELLLIKKNVLIRNSIQHRNGIVDSYILQEIGSNKLSIKGVKGNIIYLKLNDRIVLSIPEIYSFKASMLYISQLWRCF